MKLSKEHLELFLVLMTVWIGFLVIVGGLFYGLTWLLAYGITLVPIDYLKSPYAVLVLVIIILFFKVKGIPLLVTLVARIVHSGFYIFLEKYHLHLWKGRLPAHVVWGFGLLFFIKYMTRDTDFNFQLCLEAVLVGTLSSAFFTWQGVSELNKSSSTVEQAPPNS